MRNFRQRGSDETGFPCPEGMPAALHRLLVRRGIRSQEEAERFLHPGLEDLHDPFLLNDMARAVAMIRDALRGGTHIVVFGDYDADGVCAAAILAEYFASVGASAEVYLPSRHSEGYGLNEAAVRALAQRCGLMITVDCGITCADLVALSVSLGMEVIVTDHHRPGDELPDSPTVNPLLNDYPFPYLCGAGVAFQLVAALAGREESLKYIDLAAIATVADVVSLTGENRAIVALGLKRINDAPRPGVAALIESAGLQDREITAGRVSFQLAPRLNAGGRIDSARRSLELLTEHDERRAEALAAELEKLNGERVGVEERIEREALEKLRDFDFLKRRVIILSGAEWNPGVIGLAAGRIRERYYYPTIVIAESGDTCVGSCRSIDDVDIHEALSAVKHYFLRFGGHRQAAGFSMRTADLPAFAEELNQWLAEHIPPQAYVPVEWYDLDVSFSDLREPFVKALDAFQPTGVGNPAPLLRTTAEVREAWVLGRTREHLKLSLAQGEQEMEAIFFRQAGLAGRLSGQQELLFTPELNTFRGRTSIQLTLSGINPRDNFARLRANVANEPRLLRRFLTEILYNRDYSGDAPLRPVDPDALAARLRETVQGTLLVADSLETAAALLRKLGDVALDLSIGAYPTDPQAFNTLAVYPAGEPPRGYAHYVLAGLPVNLFDRPAEWLSTESGWRRELPDVDALREVYKAVRRLLSRPVYARTLETLAHALSEEAGFSEAKTLAGLFALHDMKLVSLQLDGERARLDLMPMRKADPLQSAVFQRVSRLRENTDQQTTQRTEV